MLSLKFNLREVRLGMLVPSIKRNYRHNTIQYDVLYCTHTHTHYSSNIAVHSSKLLELNFPEYGNANTHNYRHTLLFIKNQKRKVKKKKKKNPEKQKG